MTELVTSQVKQIAVLSWLVRWCADTPETWHQRLPGVGRQVGGLWRSWDSTSCSRLGQHRVNITMGLDSTKHLAFHG